MEVRSRFRLGWVTDPHLNFLTHAQVQTFLCHVNQYGLDAVIITGDIGEAADVVRYLESIDDALARPVYFVLGNHDFYGGSIAEVRRQMSELCARRANLHYLTQSDVIEVAPGIALLGHDGWADARLGDYEQSDVMLNDYLLIQELAFLSKANRRRSLEQLGDEAAAHIEKQLRAATSKYRQAILATHVPPLHEACWHEGRLSDEIWLPHFSCLAVGSAILDVMRDQPACQLTVLCGHTHSSGECQPLENVTILTGDAQYKHPRVQRVFEFPTVAVK